MKNLILDHSFTPPELQSINQALIAVLHEDSPDEASFLKLVTQRDDIIQHYLRNCDSPTRESFAEAELKVNGVLIAYANELFDNSLKQLSALVRGRKAVKKYI